MASKKRVWHLHVITAHRMTESQFTEVQSVSSNVCQDLNEVQHVLEKHVEKQLAWAFGSSSVPGTAYVIPEALSFNVEISNVEEGRGL